jgi:hypothetical protein
VSDRPHVEGDPDGIPSRYVARIYQALEEHETRAAERDTRRDAALTRQLDEIRDSLALLAPLPAQVAGLQTRLDELDGRTGTIEARDRREAERDELRRELTAQGWGPLPTHPGVLVDSAGRPTSLAPPGPRTPIADGAGELLAATARHLPIILAIVSVIAGLATGGTVVGLEAAHLILEGPPAAPAPAPTPAPPMLPDVAPVDTGPAIEGDTGAHGDGTAQGDTHQVRAR